jgi:hypothetical protein
MLDRPDTPVQRVEIESLDEVPHQAGSVVLGQETLEIARTEHDLVAPGALHPGSAPNFRLRLTDLGGREIEQDVVHLGIVAATDPLGDPPAERFTASQYIKAAEDDLVRVSDESVARRIIPGRVWLGISQRLRRTEPA